MLARFRQRLATRIAIAPDSSSNGSPSLVATEGQKALVAEQLALARSSGRVIRLRDLHAATGLPQSVALRAIRALEADGIAICEEVLHDPLDGEVRLA